MALRLLIAAALAGLVLWPVRADVVVQCRMGGAAMACACERAADGHVLHAKRGCCDVIVVDRRPSQALGDAPPAAPLAAVVPAPRWSPPRLPHAPALAALAAPRSRGPPLVSAAFVGFRSLQL